MIDQSRLTTLLFDVDDTLYEHSCGVESLVSSLINEYVEELLSIPPRELCRLRKSYIPQYGTTLRWLQVCHGYKNTLEYMERIHPPNIAELVPPNERLRRFLETTSYHKEILTNGPEFHCRRVLKALGVDEFFPRVHDIYWMDFQGKPYPSAYSRCLESLGVPAEEVLFLDDKEMNLEPFVRMGGQVLLVGSKGSGRYPSIERIEELEGILG